MIDKDKEKLSEVIANAKITLTREADGDVIKLQDAIDILDRIEKSMNLEPEYEENHLRPCPICGSRNIEAHVNPGSWGYYPASAYIVCKDCGTQSKEYDGKDDCDKAGAIRKATLAWNHRG